jgi:hypothetical protein
VSKRGERLAADVVTAVLRHTGIAKSDTGAVTLLMGVARPLSEAIVARDRVIKRADRKSREFSRELKQINRILKACVQPPAPVGIVPLRAADWETKLVPRREPPAMNGHSYLKEETGGN